MNIRKATTDDIDTLIKLRIDYLTEDFGSLAPEVESAIRQQLAAYFPKHINVDFIALLAEEDNCVVSAAFLAVAEKPANPVFITGRTGTLLNVFTYPPYRKQGFATMILNLIIDEAKKMNLSLIDLSATPDGKPLYSKLGFTETKSRYTEMRLRLI